VIVKTDSDQGQIEKWLTDQGNSFLFGNSKTIQATLWH
jgi:hypothetical protein